MVSFQALVGSSSRSNTNKYSRLDRDIERSNQDFIQDQEQQQQVSLYEGVTNKKGLAPSPTFQNSSPYTA